MPKRTYPTDAGRVEQAADLEHIVMTNVLTGVQQELRPAGANADTKNILTQHLIRGGVDLNEFDET